MSYQQPGRTPPITLAQILREDPVPVGALGAAIFCTASLFHSWVFSYV